MEKGYEVWAAGSGDEQVKKELTNFGVKCIDIPFSRNPLSYDNINAYRTVKTLLKEEDFELVHVHTPIASVLTRMAYRRSVKGKILYTAHGFHFFKGASPLNWLLYYPLERIAARWTDSLITINNEDYERAMKMGFSKGAVHSVHGVGVEPAYIDMTVEEKNNLRQSLGISNEAIVISYIAEINKNKNHKFLLDNWKKIKDKSTGTVLLLIGDGNMRTEIEKIVSDEQLEDVFVLGFRNDVNDLLQITDIVSLLSHREGLPKSIMEAMAASIPCVVSDTRGLRDLITNDENGYVVPLGDDATLVESFVTLLNDEEKRLVMGAAGYRNIEPYRLENVIQEYSKIYDDALRKG